jgi:hypothetical protein
MEQHGVSPWLDDEKNQLSKPGQDQATPTEEAQLDLAKFKNLNILKHR